MIFSIGMAIVMVLAAQDIMAGRASIGSFVLVNAMLVMGLLVAAYFIYRLEHATRSGEREIARIEAQTAGKSWEAYLADWVTRDVVERNLERVSEASRHIPTDLKARHPNVGWRLVADLGNVLRHAYDQVIDERIWQIVTSDLASLKAAVAAMLHEFEEGASDRT